jgi:methylenetetrahydrofolate--tRNA-(uracil-5-)-methyltransferase
MARGEPLSMPPRTTAIGALAYYVSHADPAHYDPSNITFGIMAPLDLRHARTDPERRRGGADPSRSKLARKLAISERALADLEAWKDGRPDLRDQPSQNVSAVSEA